MAAIKERLRYWILLAQLNPIPVAIGLGILVLLIALFLFQRRRARRTKRAKHEPASKSTPAAEVASTAKSAEAKAEAPAVPVVPAAVLAGTVAAAAAKEAKPQPEPVPPAPVEPASDSRRQLVARVADEVKNATSGGKYDEGIIGSNDRGTRQLVGAELLAALVGRNPERRERARELFMKHGYFEDATRDLRVADSSNERAAAARRLSFVHEREATPHLVGALQDPSPDVRRAAVEALMDVRDPAAIAPLNTLLQTENDRKVPRTLIKHAIDACATAAPQPPESSSLMPAVAPPSTASESEREVIEL